ncbi:MAG: hypothetical protein ACHQDF_05850 [Chitinophagales bacterium]
MIIITPPVNVVKGTWVINLERAAGAGFWAEVKRKQKDRSKNRPAIFRQAAAGSFG